MVTAENTGQAIQLIFIDICETGVALLDISERKAICTSCGENNVLFSNDKSLYAAMRSRSRAGFGMHIYALFPCAYLIYLFRILQ